MCFRHVYLGFGIGQDGVSYWDRCTDRLYPDAVFPDPIYDGRLERFLKQSNTEELDAYDNELTAALGWNEDVIYYMDNYERHTRGARRKTEIPTTIGSSSIFLCPRP